MAIRLSRVYFLAGQKRHFEQFMAIAGQVTQPELKLVLPGVGVAVGVGVGVAVEAATGAVLPAAAAPFRLPWQLQLLLPLLPAYTIELISITGWSPYNAPGAVNRSPSPATVNPPPFCSSYTTSYFLQRTEANESCVSIRMSVRGTRCGWLNALVGWLANWLTGCPA